MPGIELLANTCYRKRVCSWQLYLIEGDHDQSSPTNKLGVAETTLRAQASLECTPAGLTHAPSNPIQLKVRGGPDL